MTDDRENLDSYVGAIVSAVVLVLLVIAGIVVTLTAPELPPTAEPEPPGVNVTRRSVTTVDPDRRPDPDARRYCRSRSQAELLLEIGDRIENVAPGSLLDLAWEWAASQRPTSDDEWVSLAAGCHEGISTRG